MRKKFLLITLIFYCFIYINAVVFPKKIFADDLNAGLGESIQSYINIALANNSDINYIYLDSGTFFEQLIIDIPKGKEIHLIGQGDDSTIINLPEDISGNVFAIYGNGKIVLKKIKITAGNRSGIYINNNVTVLINNCYLENNNSSIGGGINNSGGILFINNSKIINNNAIFCGGGIYNDGILTIKDSLISDNSVLNGDGGGISNFKTLNISYSSICNNTSTNFSGIAANNGTETENQAENNWWGFESGPYNTEKNHTGDGNSVSDSVVFQPFLSTDPFSKELLENDNSDTGEKNNDGPTAENPQDLSNGGQKNNNSSNVNTSIPSLPYQKTYREIRAGYENKAYFDSLADFSSKSFITLLYNTILFREPDEEGLNDWLMFLQNKKENMAKTFEYFFFSEENDSRLNNLDNSGFIAYLYSSLFFREPDNDGFDDWLASLNNGQSRKNIFTAFINSEEWESIYASFN